MVSPRKAIYNGHIIYNQYLHVISSVPVSHIPSIHEDMQSPQSYPQYPWLIFAVPMRIFWGYSISSVDVCHIRITCNHMQYPWVISSMPVRICSVHELICMNEEGMKFPWRSTSYPYWCRISAWVLKIWLMCIVYPHQHCRYYMWYCVTHKYWGYDSQLLMTWLTETAYPHRYHV